MWTRLKKIRTYVSVDVALPCLVEKEDKNDVLHGKNRPVAYFTKYDIDIQLSVMQVTPLFVDLNP